MFQRFFRDLSPPVISYNTLFIGENKLNRAHRRDVAEGGPVNVRRRPFGDQECLEDHGRWRTADGNSQESLFGLNLF